MAATAAPGDPADARTSRVSVSSAGGQADDYSLGSAVSADGRHVAFGSAASALVPGDTGGLDVFVRDLDSRTTTRVSVSTTGAQADGDSGAPTINADGRHVAFISLASNLVAGDVPDGIADVFVRDLRTGTTRKLTRTLTGEPADGESAGPVISADGRYVSFYSYASNLVAGDTNNVRDVFVHDLRTGTTSRTSVSSAGAQADDGSYEPAINGDGRYITFYSSASNLVAEDTNSIPDVFVHDRTTGTTTRVSGSHTGGQTNGWGSFVPAIDARGRRVTFQSNGSNLVPGDTNAVSDIFVRDLRTGITTLVSVSSTGTQANSSSWDPAISPDGRYVTFATDATNLVAGDTNGFQDVFLRDLRTGVTTMISTSRTGGPANDYSADPAVSANGRRIIFTSPATNLVRGDTNNRLDVFARHAG